MPTFTNKWKANIDVIPEANNMPKVSLHSRAILTPRHNTIKYRHNKNAAPIKPNSSPTTAKIKSV